MELKIIPESQLVCPFRTKVRLVPNEYGTTDQLVEYPNCQGNACPFFVTDATVNEDRCRRTYSYE